MGSGNSNVVTIMGGLILLSLIGCVTLLAWHGTVNGQAVMTFLSGLTLGGVIGIGGHVATKVGARAALKQQGE